MHRKQGVPAKSFNKTTTARATRTTAANEICNFCINSIKIPIVMRIFANTIYLCVQPVHEGEGAGGRDEERQITWRHAWTDWYPSTRFPCTTLVAATIRATYTLRLEHAFQGNATKGCRCGRLEGWIRKRGWWGTDGNHRVFNMAPTAFAFSSANALAFALARTYRLPHNEMQFKCLWYKLLSQLPSS